MNQPTLAMIFDKLTQMKSSGGALFGAKVLPYGNPISPSLNSLYTDLGVIQVPGIVPITITWFGPALQPEQTYGLLGSQCRFSITDPTQPCTVTGWAVFLGPGGSGSGTGGTDELLYADPLSTPITLNNTTQILSYTPLWLEGVIGTNFGGGTTIQ